MNKYCFWRAFPQGKQRVFTMSWDDGNDCDTTVVELMRKYGVVGTFNLNSAYCEKPPAKSRAWRRMSMEECLALYGEDMEIALHGACHPDWSDYTPAQAMADIMDDRRYLERATGKLIRGAAAPNGRVTEDAIQALKSCGIAYCRLVDHRNGRLNFKRIPSDFLRLYPTAHFLDEGLPEEAERFVKGETIRQDLWMLYVYGHSYEAVQKNGWGQLEALLQKVSGKDTIWYATNIELVDYMNALKQLQFSADCSFVHNPTATDLWLNQFHKDMVPETFKIPAGQTVLLPFNDIE